MWAEVAAAVEVVAVRLPLKSFTRRQFQERFGLSRFQAQDTLTRMREKGLVEKLGGHPVCWRLVSHG